MMRLPQQQGREAEMHDLIVFVPRLHTKAPADDIRETVSVLVNDIQVIANSDSAFVLKALAKFTRLQRRRIREAHRQARLQSCRVD